MVIVPPEAAILAWPIVTTPPIGSWLGAGGAVMPAPEAITANMAKPRRTRFTDFSFPFDLANSLTATHVLVAALQMTRKVLLSELDIDC